MIALTSKVKRKNKLYLTFKVTAEADASKRAPLYFRTWQALGKDGTSTKDPAFFVAELIEQDQEIKVTLVDWEELVSIEVGIVCEGVAWFELLKVDL